MKIVIELEGTKEDLEIFLNKIYTLSTSYIYDDIKITEIKNENRF